MTVQQRATSAALTQWAFCHLTHLRGQGFAPTLVEDAFQERWRDGNLGDLVTIVKVTMPQDKPASLTDREYADIVAYLLKSNRFPSGRQGAASGCGRPQERHVQEAVASSA